MPFPKEAFTIHGGCNCRAVRYEVSVPPYESRPHTVYKTPGADIGDHRLPAVYMDHCNDCRRATASIMPMGLICVTKMVRVSVLPKSAEAENTFVVADSEREWLPADEVFNFQNPGMKDLHLTFYKSSPQRSRWFCGRCGTMVAYTIDEGVIPPEWNWPPMIDLWLGTVDREDLEKDYMKPERMVWYEMGIPWVREMARWGAGGIPEHPLTKIDKLVGDDTEDDLKELSTL